MIFTARLFLLIAFWSLTSGVVIAQRQTRIDLRKTGRIIAGSSITYLLSDTDELKKQSSDLRKKLADRLGLRAIVVPEIKINQKYVIGLISYDSLPDEEEVSESDFRYLRDYAGSIARAEITKKYDELVQAVDTGKDVRSKAKELNTTVEQSSNDGSAKLYAGYLVSGLAETTAKPFVADLVNHYRQHTIANFEASIITFFHTHPDWRGTPVKFGEKSERLTVGDLNDSQVERRPATSTTPSYLMVWLKRSLVIVPESPSAKFDPELYKGGLKEYVTANNPSVRSNTVVPNASVKIPS